ncbi:hypothetical protein Tco_1234581 [Tanacetum coccineum]|uniref:Uncharacterized protein n=1 Tax=Tanacetum coccineum TaxID=301880 RepID=A0ABQ5A898_9ASTR
MVLCERTIQYFEDMLRRAPDLEEVGMFITVVRFSYINSLWEILAIEIKKLKSILDCHRPGLWNSNSLALKFTWELTIRINEVPAFV